MQNFSQPRFHVSPNLKLVIGGKSASKSLLHQVLRFILILCQMECDAIQMIEVKHSFFDKLSSCRQIFFSGRSHGVILTNGGSSSKQYNFLKTWTVPDSPGTFLRPFSFEYIKVRAARGPFFIM